MSIFTTNNKIHVIPILIRNCLWKQSFAKRLQILPKNQIPICNWEIKEDAYQNIAEELITVVSTIRASLPKKDEKNIKITLTINNEELSDSDKTKLLQGLEQILGMSQGKLEIEGIKTQKFNNSVVTKVLVRAPRHEYGELMALKEIGSLKHLNIININTKDFIIKTFDFIRKHIYKSHLLNDITLISEASFDGAIDVNIGDYSQQKNNVQDLSQQSNYSKDIGDFRQHGDLYKSKNNTNIGDFGNNKSDFY